MRVPGAHIDATDFRNYINQQHGTAGGSSNFVFLESGTATAPAIENAIERALARAGSGDILYLFFSARGITEARTHDGFLLAKDTNDGNYRSAAVPVEWLKETFRAKARDLPRELYLFADLDTRCSLTGLDCPKTARGNEIEERLAELGPIKGILATQPNRLSRFIGGRGNESGLFSNVLVEVLKSHGSLSAEYRPIVEAVRNEVRNKSSKRQVPVPIAGISAPLPPWKPNFPRLPVELAALGIPNLSFLFQPQAPLGALQLRQSFRRALTEERLTGAGGAYDLLQQYRQLVPADLAADDMRDLVVALEEAAGRVVASYGRGEEFPNDPFRLGVADFRSAAEMYDLVLSLAPDHRDAEVRARFCRGRAALLTGNWRDAANEFEQAIRINRGIAGENREFPESFNGLGVAYLEQSVNQNRHADAIKQFRQASQRAPEWAYPSHNLALALAETGDYRAAEDTYREAFRLSPYHPYLAYNLGLLLEKTNRLKQAEDAYKAAQLQFHAKIAEQNAAIADFVRFRSEAGSDPKLQNRYQAEIAKTIQLVSALAQNEAETYNALGTVREQRKDRQGAAELYRVAFRSNPDLLAARQNLAMLDTEIYRSSHNEEERNKALDEAMQMWNDSLARSPADRASLLGIANVYRIRAGSADSASSRKSNFAQAITAYRSVLRANENDPEARAQLALTLAEVGDFTAAEPELARAIRLESAARKTSFATPELHEELGKIYSRGRPAEGCQQFTMARQALAATGEKQPEWLKRELQACSRK
jgi:tetratricopeptide (TPR) repeat protein